MRRWTLRKPFESRQREEVVGTGPRLAPDETVEVVPLSEVREALLERTGGNLRKAIGEVFNEVEAAFSSTDSEGQDA